MIPYHLDNRSKHLYRLGAFFLGFTAISFQIVLLREFMVSFYGNELSTGIVLAVWLLWSGLGAWVGSLISETRVEVFLFTGHALFVFIVPLTLVGLVFVRSYWGVTGEIVGIIPIIATALCVETLFCLVSGILFTLYCQKDYSEQGTWLSIGRIYFMESLGAMVGGLLFSFLLVHLFRPFQFAVVLSCINLAICFYFLLSSRGRIASVVTACLALYVGFLVADGVRLCEEYTLEKRWPQTEVIENRFTKYGNLVITQSEEQLTVYENGLLFFSYPDALSVEENVHLALLQHPDPGEVLVIGGALGGELEEVLGHNPVSVTYVELDPAMIESARSHLEPLDRIMKEDSRIRLYTGDGRFFLATTDQKFDVIILISPDPGNAQINRFYTRQFFETVSNRLKPAGIFSFSVSSAENYIDQTLARYLAVMTETLRSVFGFVTIFPGPRCRFFASKNDVLTEKAELLIRRLEQRNLEPDFVNRYYLPFQLTPERKEYLSERIESVPEEQIRINRDFHPISYYFDMMLWSSRLNAGGREFFLMMEKVRMSAYILFCLVITIISLVLHYSHMKVTAWFIGLPVAIIGFSEMTLQIVLILAFQVLYGYAYYKLGILVTCCMAGIAAGSFWVNSYGLIDAGSALQKLIKVQGLMIVYPLGLFGLLLVLSQPSIQFLRPISVLIVFPLMAIGGGFIGGAHFPLAALSLQHTQKNVQSTAGRLFWFDLSGSGLGALFLGAFFIPLLGITKTLLLLTSLNIAALLTLILYSKKN